MSIASILTILIDKFRRRAKTLTYILLYHQFAPTDPPSSAQGYLARVLAAHLFPARHPLCSLFFVHFDAHYRLNASAYAHHWRHTGSSGQLSQTTTQRLGLPP